VTLASIAVGIALAFPYHLTSARTQLWLSKRVSRGLPVLFVAALFARLIVVGLVFLAIGRWTSLDLIVVVVAFVTAFTILGGLSLYRLAVKGRQSASPVHLLP
jgi:hypothetical protein